MVSKAILGSGVGEVIREKRRNFTFNRNYHPYEKFYLKTECRGLSRPDRTLDRLLSLM